MNKTILHIDFDSFFASCEQQDNPLLRNKPLGVTATNGRTCIIASSHEAKKLGIKTGSRTYEALQICPELTLVPAHFVKYLEISKTFLRICQNFSPDVELFSIDEVFMDVTLTSHLFNGVYKMINKIKQKIKKEIGEYITVSVGISHNKLLAKLASGINKPNGVFEITKNNLNFVYSKAKLTDVCGIGERIKLRLNMIGIYSLLELKNAPLPRLVSEFGNFEGHFLKNIGLGIDSNLLTSFTKTPSVKSVGRNYCLPKNTYDKKIILQNIFELCEEIGIKLRRLKKKARTIGFSLRGNINMHARKTYNEYFDTGKEIFDLCLAIIRNEQRHSGRRSRISIVLDSGVVADAPPRNDKVVYVRQISIWAASLEDEANIPLSLFDSPKKSKLIDVIDKINDKFGDHTIRNGFLLYADKLTTVPNGYTARL